MGCFTECLKCCGGSILILALFAATLGISITSLVLGIINLNSNCTGITQIPAYLITTGILGLTAFLVKCCDTNKREMEDNKKKENGFLNLVHLAQIGVLIWGSIILFSKSRPDCDTVLYDYAYAITLAAYVCLALFLLYTFSIFGLVFCYAMTNHCCGDGTVKLTYSCSCCDKAICADPVTRRNKLQTKKTINNNSTINNIGTLDKPDIVIDMDIQKNTTTSEV